MVQISVWLPDDRVYDRTSYLWIKDGLENGNLLVGIGRPTIESLGELSYLKISSPGTQVTRDESVGSMEAAKMTGEIVSPISGTLVARNETILEDPRKVGEDPYESGWLFEIKPDCWEEEKQQLLDSAGLFDLLPEDLRGPAIH